MLAPDPYTLGWDSIAKSGFSHGVYFVATYYFDAIQPVLVTWKTGEVIMFRDEVEVLKLGTISHFLEQNAKSAFPYFWKFYVRRPEIPDRYDE